MCESGQCEKCQVEIGLELQLTQAQLNHQSDYQRLTLYRAMMTLLETARHAGAEKFIETFDESLARMKDIEKCQ